MSATKIQDEREVIRWFEEGRTYQWMTDEYRRKYNIETVPSLWGNFRRRKGLARRINRDDDMIPWAIQLEHRQAYPLFMLRVAAREQAGMALRAVDKTRLSAWRAELEEASAVVHYDPDTEAGWFFVKRRDGIDLGLIREPEQKTTRRRRAEEGRLDPRGSPRMSP